MAGVSDDDVPTESMADRVRRDGDGDAVAVDGPLAEADDEEDRTVRSSRLEPQSLRKAEPPAPTSRKLTAVGLGAPPPATRPAAGYVPPPIPPPAPPMAPSTEAEEIDESITAQAPAPRVSPHLPLPIEGSVSIRTLEDDEADETEVRTMPGAPETIASLAKKTAPPRAVDESEDPTHERVADDAYDAEDSVTTRGPALETAFEDDSVTAALAPLAPVRSPAVAPPPHAPLEDGTGGTTQKVRGRTSLPRAPIPAAGSPAQGSPADEEKESITTQAPGHLTNMLRVIAAGSSVDALEPIDEDDLPQNKTAVMPNAPVKPDGSARAGAAPQLHPSSESGLRMTRPGSQSGERASLGALSAPPARPSSVGLTGPADGMAFNSEVGPMFHSNPLAPPLAGDGQRPEGKPRYGLIVGLAAVLSFAIPIALFFFLKQSGPGISPLDRENAEPAADLVQRADEIRPKATKGAHTGTNTIPSASASASSAVKKR